LFSATDLSGKTSRTGIYQDLTGQVATTYSGLGAQQNYANQTDCAIHCRAAGVAYHGQSNSAAPFCAAGVANYAGVQPFSAVGSTAYYQARDPSKNPIFFSATLHHIVQQSHTTATCPATWYANSSNVLGGVTSDGKCKKLAGTISPSPPQQTGIGSWGFTWFNEVWAYGDHTNGGAATVVTTVTQQGVCSWY
jgi:hypothetical protein